jgi:hypothetical protein
MFCDFPERERERERESERDNLQGQMSNITTTFYGVTVVFFLSSFCVFIYVFNVSKRMLMASVLDDQRAGPWR